METDDSVKIEPKDSSQLSSVSSTPIPASGSSLNTPASNLAAATTTTTSSTKTKLPSIVLPEVDLYLNLIIYQCINNQYIAFMMALNLNLSSKLFGNLHFHHFLKSNYYFTFL